MFHYKYKVFILNSVHVYGKLSEEKFHSLVYPQGSGNIETTGLRPSQAVEERSASERFPQVPCQGAYVCALGASDPDACVRQMQG